MPDFAFAHENYEVMMARRRAQALEAFVLLHKQNSHDPMFWHLTADQRRRICERFDEETFDRLLSRLNEEYETDGLA